MEQNLRLLSTDGSEELLHSSSSQPVSLGRDEANTVTLPTEAASRHHGFFLFADYCWTFWDNYSTNGTMYNDAMLRPGQHVVIRDGDVLKLADYELRCEISGIPPESSAFLVFSDDGFIRSGSLEVEGIPISFGSESSNINLGLVGNDFSVERRIHDGSSSSIFVDPAADSSLRINGVLLKESAELVDNDEIFINRISILVLDPKTKDASSSFNATKDDIDALGKSVEEFSGSRAPSPVKHQSIDSIVSSDGSWRTHSERRKAKSSKKFVFGSAREDERGDGFDPTRTTQMPIVPMSSSAKSSAAKSSAASHVEVSSSQRFARASAAAEADGEQSKELMLALFGVFVFACIIAFILYFI